MTIEKALLEALRYEARIRDLYLQAARDAASRNASDPAASAFFRSLGEDERRHAEFIERKLGELRKGGSISFEELASSLPEPGKVEADAKKAGAALGGARGAGAAGLPGGELEALRRALAAEESTSAMYRELAGSLSGPAAEIFARLLEIEEGHERIVRAELDLASRTGFWFDLEEFGQEA